MRLISTSFGEQPRAITAEPIPTAPNDAPMSEASVPTPPAPPSQGGEKKRARSLNLRNEVGRNGEVERPQLCTTSGL